MQKNPDYRGCFGGLQGIKIHFHEFLYDFALKRSKLLESKKLSGITPEYLFIDEAELRLTIFAAHR
jgi:hypothetical protein